MLIITCHEYFPRDKVWIKVRDSATFWKILPILSALIKSNAFLLKSSSMSLNILAEVSLYRPNIKPTLSIFKLNFKGVWSRGFTARSTKLSLLNFTERFCDGVGNMIFNLEKREDNSRKNLIKRWRSSSRGSDHLGFK